MNRKECEQKIYELAQELYEVYGEYNPNPDYLTMTWYGDGTLTFQNAYYDKDSEYPINFLKDGDVRDSF